MKQKKALVVGYSGFITKYLRRFLKEEGWYVKVISRDHAVDEDVYLDDYFIWQPTINETTPLSLHQLSTFIDGCDVIFNFSGSSIANGRLNKSHFKKLLKSRIEPIEILLEAIHFCKKKPQFWFQASGIGYYGDSKDKIISEESNMGNDDLAVLCYNWESTLLDHQYIKDYNINVVILRLGIVLAKDAPAWKKMLLPIKYYMGGVLGNGNQWISWIHIDDVLKAIHFILINKVQGVVNLVAPYPIQQKIFSQIVAKFLHRPNFFIIPSFILKLILGKQANYLVLSSCKATPNKLLLNGFEYDYETLETTMNNLCGNNI